ncbi:MAG: YdcF family protein, partial [Xanthobacteraceae bacterium]
KYPDARIIFTGGNAELFDNVTPESAIAVRLFVALGISPDRITAEEQSRNTIENAVFSELIAQPKRGERWLLVTSASHMPRAMAVFRAAGFPVEAYPVDYRTRGLGDAMRPFSSVALGMAQTDLAMHEWAGLIAYRLTGKTEEFFPAP